VKKILYICAILATLSFVFYMISENYIVKRSIAGIVKDTNKTEVLADVPVSPIEEEQPSMKPVSRTESVYPASRFYEDFLKGVQTFSPILVTVIIHLSSRNSRKQRKVESPA
jgi:hypothetical protein